MGRYLAGFGYRGILGIDFLIDKEMKLVYPVECNPRFTGAFPMLSQLHICHDLLPMDVFHILEFLDIPYDLDPVSLNLGYAKTIKGSHMILFNLSGEILGGRNLPDAGLYEFDPDAESIDFLQEASDYREIRTNRQFVIIDGPPDAEGERIVEGDPLHRLCRVLFPCPVVDGKDVLSSRAVQIADWVYRRVLP